MHLTVCCWFLISSGWGREGGGSRWGRSEGPSWRGRIRGVERENKRCGAGWLRSLMLLSGPSRLIKFLYSPTPPSTTVLALDLPTIHPVKVTRGLVCIKQPMHLWFIQPCTSLYIMFWMCAWEVGGGWALEFSSFLGPKWPLPIGSLPFHRAQKTLEFQCPTPSHFPL
jgi:hypothetical protein